MAAESAPPSAGEEHLGRLLSTLRGGMDILSSRGDDIVRTRCAAAGVDEFLGGAEEAACCALLAGALVRIGDRAFCIAGENASFQTDAGEWCLRIMPMQLRAAHASFSRPPRGSLFIHRNLTCDLNLAVG